LESNPASLKQKLASIEADIALYNEPAPQLEPVMDEYLREKLWSKDTSQVKATILEYATGRASLSDLEVAVNNTLNPSAESGAFTSSDILQMSIRYHNAKHHYLDTWNLEDYVSYIDQNVNSDNLLLLCRQMRQRLERHNIDPLVINLVSILIGDEKVGELSRVLDDFSQIMKIYRGEIEGVVSCAHEMSNEDYQSIIDALTKENPGKKITMTKSVEPGLLSGFVVKAGVHKFDFSLLTHIEKSRQAMQV